MCHLLTCSVWCYAVTSPCPDSQGWCCPMGKLPDDSEGCFKMSASYPWQKHMKPHSVSTFKYVSWYVITAECFYWYILACHYSCLWPRPRDICCICSTVFTSSPWWPCGVLHHVASSPRPLCVMIQYMSYPSCLIWCYNLSVPSVGDPICCYTGYVPSSRSPQMTLHNISIIGLMSCMMLRCVFSSPWQPHIMLCSVCIISVMTTCDTLFYPRNLPTSAYHAVLWLYHHRGSTHQPTLCLSHTFDNLTWCFIMSNSFNVHVNFLTAI